MRSTTAMPFDYVDRWKLLSPIIYHAAAHTGLNCDDLYHLSKLYSKNIASFYTINRCVYIATRLEKSDSGGPQHYLA